MVEQKVLRESAGVISRSLRERFWFCVVVSLVFGKEDVKEERQTSVLSSACQSLKRSAQGVLYFGLNSVNIRLLNQCFPLVSCFKSSSNVDIIVLSVQPVVDLILRKSGCRESHQQLASDIAVGNYIPRLALLLSFTLSRCMTSPYIIKHSAHASPSVTILASPVCTTWLAQVVINHTPPPPFQIGLASSSMVRPGSGSVLGFTPPTPNKLYRSRKDEFNSRRKRWVFTSAAAAWTQRIYSLPIHIHPEHGIKWTTCQWSGLSPPNFTSGKSGLMEEVPWINVSAFLVKANSRRSEVLSYLSTPGTRFALFHQTEVTTEAD